MRKGDERALFCPLVASPIMDRGLPAAKCGRVPSETRPRGLLHFGDYDGSDLVAKHRQLRLAAHAQFRGGEIDRFRGSGDVGGASGEVSRG